MCLFPMDVDCIQYFLSRRGVAGFCEVLRSCEGSVTRHPHTQSLSVGSITPAAEQRPAIIVMLMSHESLIEGRSRSLPTQRPCDRTIGAANSRRAAAWFHLKLRSFASICSTASFISIKCAWPFNASACRICPAVTTSGISPSHTCTCSTYRSPLVRANEASICNQQLRGHLDSSHSHVGITLNYRKSDMDACRHSFYCKPPAARTPRERWSP